MPELPEVEVLVRHLRPLLQNQTIREVQVHRARVLRPTSVKELTRTLRGARFVTIARRGKYLLFNLQPPRGRKLVTLIGHLGMTGRMYLLAARTPLPQHAAVVLGLGRQKLVFEDTRYFGRLTLAAEAIERLGPEPLSEEFRAEVFAQALKRSDQPIKVRLLDQALVAGVGNIYASEALFRAGISPGLPSRRLTAQQAQRLWRAIRKVLRQAIDSGSTVPLDYSGVGKQDGLFYFGRAPGAPDFYEERLRVYDRAGLPCAQCGSLIKRIVQAGRSTFYCAQCQHR
ncbi:MAG TPA: bifunctional DNA-formamidopyrimidine glycosylase/DNA-(apurinic or apyrimidinic site) lyase [Candidatus Binatia bacterium]|jgi:formamidopyrimidine-DNA glycosylase|nr:bifunctional DNA-formamidopyrimidine glycosylase/DNA-(apurinic or apyrimidinic site) lyase [Candidatus Binatia bacterium]